MSDVTPHPAESSAVPQCVLLLVFGMAHYLAIASGHAGANESRRLGLAQCRLLSQMIYRYMALYI